MVQKEGDLVLSIHQCGNCDKKYGVEKGSTNFCCPYCQSRCVKE